MDGKFDQEFLAWLDQASRPCKRLKGSGLSWTAWTAKASRQATRHTSHYAKHDGQWLNSRKSTPAFEIYTKHWYVPLFASPPSWLPVPCEFALVCIAVKRLSHLLPSTVHLCTFATIIGTKPYSATTACDITPSNTFFRVLLIKNLYYYAEICQDIGSWSTTLQYAF